jgi:hypothetical protein
MTVHQETSKSPIAAGLFYAAGYLTLGALLVLGYQTLTWFREGVWIVHRMWQVLESIGWQHAPTVPGSRTQATVDLVWAVIGNCPIAFALSLAAMITIVAALISGSASTRAAELRDAH